MRIAIGLSLGACLCVFVLHVQVDAQRTEAALPLSIDGSRQPELITDSLALRHLILALATSPSAGLVEHERRDALLSRVQLISEDNHAFLAILEEVSARLALIPRDGGPDARAQQLAALDEAGSRLSKTLSPRGWEVLQVFVRTRVKTKIRVYGEPEQR